MKAKRVLLNGLLVIILALLSGLTASSAQPQIELGEPGLSYRYTHTLGETETAYLEDSEHINLPWGIGSDGTNLWVAELKGGRALKYDGSGSFLMQIGTAGQGNLEGLPNIKDVGIDAAGNVWLVDGMTHHINQYDPTGMYLSELGQSGDCSSANDRFCGPSGIAFDGDGNIYVSDNLNSRIQVLDSTGAYLATIGQTGAPGQGNDQFDQPEHIAVYANWLYVADSNNQRIQIFDISIPTAPTYFATMGETGVPGGDNDHFACPTGVDTDADNIYIADSCNNRIQIFVRSTRVYSATIGSGPGQGDNEFDTPTDVVVNSSGSIFVADLVNTRVQQFDASLSYVRTFGTTRVPYLTDGYHYNNPSSLAVDAMGNVFITETQGFRLIKLDASGTFQWAVGEAGLWGSDDSHFGSWLGFGPLAVAADGSGGAYAADTSNQRVLHCSSSGVCTTFAGVTGESGSDDEHFNFPFGLAVDASGRVYVGDAFNQRVQRCTPEGICTTFAGVTGEPGNDNGHLNVPTGVAVDAESNVYVADTGNQRIQKFDSSGTWLMQVGITEEPGSDFSHFMDPRDVSVDGSGRIFVSDGNNNRVQVFDAAGAYLTTIGGSWGANTGQLRYTPGVDFDSQGNIYVADEWNDRVQVFAEGVPAWKQVNINGFGEPTTVSVTSLEPFAGQLYAGTANYEDGGQVWRSSNGIDWSAASEPGFTNTLTNTIPVIIDLIEFKGQLYAGAGWDNAPGQIWRTTDGLNWEQVVGDGFGNPENTGVSSFIVISDTLYAGVDNWTQGIEIWRSGSGDNSSWTPVVTGGLGYASNHNLTGFAQFDGLYYLATEGIGPCQVWRSADGETWDPVTIDCFGKPLNSSTGGWANYQDYLYIATLDNETGAHLWRSSDGLVWEAAAPDGFGDTNNIKIESLYPFDGKLFGITQNNIEGMEVWQTFNGIDWSQINTDGFGNSNNFATLWTNATTTFKNQLYVGSWNFASGGEIWKLASFLYLPIMAK